MRSVNAFEQYVVAISCVEFAPQPWPDKKLFFYQSNMLIERKLR